MVLSARDLKRLEGVHPDLVRLIKHAAGITEVPFMVLEGVRSPARHAALLKAGASMTKNSRHLTGHAVDLGGMVPFVDEDGDGADDDGIHGLRWDWPLYHKLGATLKAAAQEINLPIEWGGDWKVFKDGPHFQLPRKTHPYNERKIT
jgi:peptidoglycan L-alanyl-D-glutamate endopeptidase CwlK